jgi:hypothetical protein
MALEATEPRREVLQIGAPNKWLRGPNSSLGLSPRRTLHGVLSITHRVFASATTFGKEAATAPLNF